MKNFTEKDLAYISDMFQWNSNALLLANHFLEEMDDAENAEVVELLEEIFEMHYQNLHKCIRILNGESTEFFEEEYEEDYTEEESEDADIDDSEEENYEEEEENE